MPNLLYNVGCIIDSPSLYEHLSAKEYLSIAQRLKNLPKSEIDRVLSIVDLLHARTQIITTFSLGMKQRLAIANALLGQPKLLILDEPTNGLDPQGIIEIRKLLKKLPQEMDVSVFISSHLLDEIEKMVSHVAIIKSGRVIKESGLSSLIGDSGKLVLQVNHLNNAKKIIERMGMFCEVINKDHLVVKNILQSQCPTLNNCLFKNNIQLFSASFLKPSLEQTFMNLVNP